MIMRKIDVPTDEQLQGELLVLYARLQALQEKADKEGRSTLDLVATQHQIEEKEALASERDPIRRKILFCRANLLALREKTRAKLRSPEREEIADKIREYEVALADALARNIEQLDKRILDLRQRMGQAPADSPLAKEINLAEAELRQNEAELRVLQRIFPRQKAESYRLKSEKEIRPMTGGGCMTAVYKGVEALYTQAESSKIEESVLKTAGERGDKLVAAAKKRGVTDKERLKSIRESPNCVDLIMETMTKLGKAGEAVTVKYDTRKEKWKPSPESVVLGMIKPDFQGWYFFGMSLSGGYHSVILAVDNSQGGEPQIYWMDQYSKGFKNNVTKTLQKEMKDFKPSYGYSDTRIWPLLPPNETGG